MQHPLDDNKNIGNLHLEKSLLNNKYLDYRLQFRHGLCLGLLVRRDPLQHVLEARHILVGFELEQCLLQSLVEPSSTILKTRNLFTVASDLETSETVKITIKS